MTTTDPGTHEPLDRVIQLRSEIESHRDRLQGLATELKDKDPKVIAEALTFELCDTMMSLFADFAGATADTLEYEHDYLVEEIEPALFDDDEPDPDGNEPDESQLTAADATEYGMLLGAYRTMLAAQYEAASNDELKAEIQNWIARVDQQLARTIEITLDT